MLQKLIFTLVSGESQEAVRLRGVQFDLRLNLWAERKGGMSLLKRVYNFSVDSHKGIRAYMTHDYLKFPYIAFLRCILAYGVHFWGHAARNNNIFQRQQGKVNGDNSKLFAEKTVFK